MSNPDYSMSNPNYTVLSPRAALQLVADYGVATRHFWDWAKQPNDDIDEFRLYEG
jgi:hypothetical protein